MFYGNGRHYFVGELCRLMDGRLVVPRIWVMRFRRVHAYCNIVYRVRLIFFTAIPGITNFVGRTTAVPRARLRGTDRR